MSVACLFLNKVVSAVQKKQTTGATHAGSKLQMLHDEEKIRENTNDTTSATSRSDEVHSTYANGTHVLETISQSSSMFLEAQRLPSNYRALDLQQSFGHLPSSLGDSRKVFPSQHLDLGVYCSRAATPERLVVTSPEA